MDAVSTKKLKTRILLAWHGGYLQTIDENNTVHCNCPQSMGCCLHVQKIIADIKYSTHHYSSSKCEPGSLAETRLTHSSEDER